MKKECPNCAVEVEERHENCPICGYEFPQGKSNRHHLFTWVAVILIVLFIIPLVVFLLRILK